MLESIKNFLNLCPYIEDIKNSFSDYANLSFSLHGKGNDALSSYIDGSRLMKMKFRICVRENFGPEECLPAIELCNKIALWLRAQSESGRFPDCGEGIFPQYFELENDPLIEDSSVSSAIYFLDCYFVYYEKRR